jgi:hypothetical protein
VKGIEPRDQIEAMLAAQMAVVHKAAMKFEQRIAVAENLIEAETAERMLNKCTRTFASQIQTLKLYRGRAEPRVTFQNLSVNEGSQAIVGNFTQQTPDKTASSIPAITDARTVPMPLLDAQKPRLGRAWRKSNT